MVGEQTANYRYRTTGSQEDEVEIQMRVQLQIPDDDPYGDIGIEMGFEPIFPAELEDELYQRLYNGVHGGIALSGVYLVPPDNMVVRVRDLKVSPLPQSTNTDDYKINLGYLLEVAISGVVETLLRGMENLRTGKETYLEW